MASIKDATELTTTLEDLVGNLRSELENGTVDFERLVSVSDELSERADALAETFSSINDTLTQRISEVKNGGGGGGGSRGSRSSRKEDS